MQSSGQGFVRKAADVAGISMDGGASIRWLITHRDGAENFSMRLIEIPKGKKTPSHSHNYEHEIFVIEGNLNVTIGERKYTASKDGFIFVPPNDHHNMEALEDSRIICVVPISAAKQILGD